MLIWLNPFNPKILRMQRIRSGAGRARVLRDSLEPLKADREPWQHAGIVESLYSYDSKDSDGSGGGPRVLTTG